MPPALLSMLALASAADVPVPAGSDLAVAVASAADGDRLLLAAGDHDLEGVSLAGRALELQGEGSASTRLFGATLELGDGQIALIDLTVDGEDDRRGVSMGAGSLTLDRVVIRRGDADGGAGLRVTGGSVTAVDSAFEASSAWPGEGGHIYMDGGSLTATRTRFADGSSREGGAIWADDATLVLEACAFEANVASTGFANGGAVVVRGGSLEVRGGSFSGNATAGAFAAGGAIHVELGGSLVVTGARFDANEARFGGAVSCVGAARCALEDVVAVGNTAEGGGVLYASDVPDLGVRGALWCGNTADEGGAAAIDGSDASLERVFLHGNAATARGGALSVDGGTFSLFRATFVANRAPEGASVDGAGAGATLRNALFAHHDGAAPVRWDGEPAVAWSLWWANAVDGDPVGDPVLFVDPGWDGDPAVVDCEAAPWTPPEGSPLIDAGDPSVVDSDGTPSDLGAFDGPPCAPVSVCPDDDDDGHGDPARADTRCAIPPGWVASPCDDCDDGDPDVHPGADDIPGELDRDCSGFTTTVAFGTACAPARGCSGGAAWLMVLPLPLLARRRR